MAAMGAGHPERLPLVGQVVGEGVADGERDVRDGEGRAADQCLEDQA